MKLLIYHNVIAPYKIPFFESICENWNGEVKLLTTSSRRNSRKEWGEQQIQANNLTVNRIPGIHAPGIGWYNPTIFPRIINEDFDILMTGDYHFISSILATYAAVIKKKPRVLYTVATRQSSIPGSDESVIYSFLDTILQYGTGRKFLLSNVLKRYNHYITTSETSVNHLISNGVSKNNISIIYNTVDIDKFQPGKFSNNRFSKQTSDGRFTLIYVGRIVPEKGLDKLIRAIALCENEISLLIAGDGPYTFKIKKEANRLGIRDQIKFFGWIDHDDVPKLHAAGDAFVLPSIPTGNNVEQFPNALLEAMASGLPAITFDIDGGIKEIHEHGVTGVKASELTSNSLAGEIDNLIIKNYKILGENARKHIISEFSPDEIGKQYAGTLYNIAKRDKLRYSD